MVGSQIIINLWVWNSYHILPMKNDKSKPNSMWDPENRSGCHDPYALFHNQHGGPCRHPVNAGCSNFRYRNNNQSNYLVQRYYKKKKKNEQGKTTKIYFTINLRAILQKKCIEKEL